MRAIVKYEVQKELEPIDPAYGRYQLIGEYDDINKAVDKCKELSKTMSHVSVTAKVYSHEENYKKKLCYDSTPVWSEYAKDWWIDHAKQWINKTVQLFERYD